MKVFQIGLGSFGRYGFEKLVEMHKHMEEPEIELVAICDKDMDRLEKAEKFAEANSIDLKTFLKPRKLYQEAEKHQEVLIYDSGPSQSHSRNIERSMRKGFFHIAEKPPSMKREQHINQKKLAQEKQVFWKVDFIERQNPVVIKTKELLEDEEIEEIQVYRESCAGVQKILQPGKRLGIKGGDILDKMIHEVFVLDFIEVTGKKPELELRKADSEFFMPKKPMSDSLMTIYGGKTQNITQETATAMTSAVFESDNVDIKLNSSWLGFSEKSRETASEIKQETGHDVLNSSSRISDDNAYRDQESRYFIIKGSRNLAGDLLNNTLYDMETGEEIKITSPPHDQLYRVLENGIKTAAGLKNRNISDKEKNIFINGIFDVRDEAVKKDYDIYEELEKSREKIKSLIFSLETGEEEVEA